MEFMKVQIPYRGGIPILNRRGPIPSVELDVDTIKTLISYGIEVLNPDNGKLITFEETSATEVAAEPAVESVVEKPMESKPTEAPKVEAPAAEAVPTKEDHVAVAETPAAEPAKVEETTEATETDADDTDEAVDGADAFDYTKIANYSALSKSKRKELRKFFAEHSGKMDVNILYATLNTMAKK